jgi:hypothetical protein
VGLEPEALGKGSRESGAQSGIAASFAGPSLRRKPTLEDRAIARLLAPWLDRELAGDTEASLSSAHAARMRQLSNERTRQGLARTLDRLVKRTDDRQSRLSNWTIQPCTEQVHNAKSLILSTASRLRSGEPLDAVGIARLKTLLRDLSGPCYAPSRPDALTIALQDISDALGVDTGGDRGSVQGSA